MKIIKLTQNCQTIVDDEDFEELKKFKWFAWKTNDCMVYAARHFGTKKIVKMQNYLLNPPLGMIVDHVNGDSLDNRKENLRICTQKENVVNRGTGKNNKSGIKGVQFRRKINGCYSWYAMIGVGKINGKRKNVHLGCFKTPNQAAKIYDMAAIILWGHYAWLNNQKNFIPGLKLRYALTGKYWTE